MKAGVARTRAALAMNALRAKAEKRAQDADHSEFLESATTGAGQLTEQQVQLLTKLRGVVNDRITLANNYRGLLGFALYVALYFFSVYTQRDTSRTYDIEQSLLRQFVDPMQSGESGAASHSAASDLYGFLRATLLPVFIDAVCGNGICEPPGEFAGVNGNIGCRADCGEHEDLSTFVVFLSDTRVPTGQTRAANPLLTWVDEAEMEPKYTWNAYSDNLEQWMFDANQPVVGGSPQAVAFNVPDGNLTIRLFQEVQLYGSGYDPALVNQFAPADHTMIFPTPQFQGHNYGDFTEAMAWNTVKMQYAFQADDATVENLDLNNYNSLNAEGVLLPVGGMLLAEDNAGVILPILDWAPCRWSPEFTVQFRNATNCNLGAINGTCYDFNSMHAAWKCTDEHTFEVRHHTPPGERAGKIKPASTASRTISASNTLIGAVVISQRRWGEVPCATSTDSVQKIRQKVLGNMASMGRCKSGLSSEPFGVDPTFLPVSKLYNGKVRPRDWYSDDEFASKRVPYGFYPVSHFQGDGVEDASSFNVYLDSRMTTAEATRAIDYLEEGFFLDNLTESVQIKFLMYNPDLDAIADLVITVSLSEGGATHTSYSIMSMALHEFIDTTANVVVALLVTLAAAFMVYDEFDEVLEFYRKKKLMKYFTDMWNVIDWAAYVSVPLSLWMFLWLSRYMQTQLSIAGDDGEAPYPLADPGAEARLFKPDVEREKLLMDIEFDFQWYANALSIYSAWTAMNVMILMFRLFKVLDFQGRLGLITRTFSKSFSDMVHFIFLFIFVLVAFAVMGQKLYGRQLPQFKDFSSCLMSLIRMTFAIGDDPYFKMLAANRYIESFTALYYLIFFFLSSVVLVNVFLAILLEAFGDVKENASNSESIFDGLSTLAQYDAALAQQQVMRLMKAKGLGLRFLPDEMLLQLLDAWIQSEKDRGVDIGDSFGKSFMQKKKNKRRASWGGCHAKKGTEEEDEEDVERVVELSDGSQLTQMQLSGLMLSLITGAPDKIRQHKSKDLTSKMASTFFKSSSTTASSQVAPDDAADAATDSGGGVVSEGDSSALTSVQQRAGKVSSMENWWQSVRRGITDIQGPKTEDEAEAAVNNLVSVNTRQNRKLKVLVRSLMSRYGKDVDEDQEEDKNMAYLKLEALQKQLDFYERYDKLEERFNAFMEQYGRDQQAVAGLISRNRGDLIS